MKIVKLSCLGLGVTALIACTHQRSHPVAVSQPVPQVVKTLPPPEVTTHPLPLPAVKPMNPNPEGSRPQKRKPKPAPPAVLALMGKAEQSSAQGLFDSSAASLERALRIQPRSAELWCRLAKIRLQQRHFSLAENLAKKSNSLASGAAEIMSRNLAIIAAVKHQQGDDAAEISADEKVKHYK